MLEFRSLRASGKPQENLEKIARNWSLRPSTLGSQISGSKKMRDHAPEGVSFEPEGHDGVAQGDIRMSLGFKSYASLYCLYCYTAIRISVIPA